MDYVYSKTLGRYDRGYEPDISLRDCDTWHRMPSKSKGQKMAFRKLSPCNPGRRHSVAVSPRPRAVPRNSSTREPSNENYNRADVLRRQAEWEHLKRELEVQRGY